MASLGFLAYPLVALMAMAIPTTTVTVIRRPANNTRVVARANGRVVVRRAAPVAEVDELADDLAAFVAPKNSCNVFCDGLADMVPPMQRSLEQRGSLRHTSYGFVCVELHSGGAEAPVNGNKCLQRLTTDPGSAPWGQRVGEFKRGLQHFFNAVQPATNTTVLVMLQDDGFLPREHVTTLRKHGIPVLAFCAECDRDDIMLMPDPEFLATNGQSKLAANVDQYSRASPWKTKRPVVAFRGGSTGIVPPNATRKGLAVNPRLRVALAARDPKASSILDVGVEKSTKKPFSWIKPGSHGPPWSPEGFWKIEDRNIIHAMYSLNLVKERQDKSQMVTARGLLDIDGFTNSWSGLYWKLRSNSVVLKVQSKFCEWYYNDLQPGVHYLAVENDLSNLLDVAQAVVAIDETNDSKMMQIATQATQFTKTLTFESEVKRMRQKLEPWGGW